MTRLTQSQLEDLSRISLASCPCVDVNARVLEALRSGGFVRVVKIVSPFAAYRKGEQIDHAQITPRGLEELRLAFTQPPVTKRKTKR